MQPPEGEGEAFTLSAHLLFFILQTPFAASCEAFFVLFVFFVVFKVFTTEFTELSELGFNVRHTRIPSVFLCSLW